MKNFFNFLGKYDEKMVVYEDHEMIQRAFKSGVSAKILKDIGVVSCFRRFKKEGADLYKKYFIATSSPLTKGPSLLEKSHALLCADKACTKTAYFK